MYYDYGDADPMEQQRSPEGNLLAAAKASDVNAVLRALRNAPTIDINVQDENDKERKRSPLHWAAHKGALWILHTLLARGASLEIRDIKGYTPLQYAVWNGKMRVVEELKAYGADLETRSDIYERTPLLKACEKQDRYMVVQLLELGACIKSKDKFDQTALHLACVSGNRDQSAMVEILLNNGADRDAKNNRHKTALMISANLGKVNSMRALLESNSKVDTKCLQGWTAFHGAVDGNHLRAVRLLLEYGAATDTKTNDGATPLHFAKRAAVTEELLRRGANIFECKNDNRTPFDEAVAQNRPAVFQCILEHFREKFVETHGILSLHELFTEANYVEVEERRNDGNNGNNEVIRNKMIHLRVGRFTVAQMLESLQFLLLQDPDMIRAQDSHRSTPLHILCQDARDAPIELVHWVLEESLLTLQVFDSVGRLPLHMACQARARVATLQTLVGQGGVGMLRTQDHDGALPLHLLLSARADDAEDGDDDVAEDADDNDADENAADGEDNDADENAANGEENDADEAQGDDDDVDAVDAESTVALSDEELSLLHAVKYLVKLHPGSVETRNHDGEIPLMLACHSSAPPDVLFVLLKTFPDSAAYLKTYYTDP